MEHTEIEDIEVRPTAKGSILTFFKVTQSGFDSRTHKRVEMTFEKDEQAVKMARDLFDNGEDALPGHNSAHKDN